MSVVVSEDFVFESSPPAVTTPPSGGGVVVTPASRWSTSATELGRRLLLAARAGDTATVNHLMAVGAPFTSDWLGTGPLHAAAAGGHARTCGVLLWAGAHRDQGTKVDRTPLHFAAQHGHLEVVNVLLDHNANIDPRDMLGMTPLHWAVERGHGDVATLLLRRGADPQLKCRFHRTPFDIARRNQSPLLQILTDALNQRELKLIEEPETEVIEESDNFEVISNSLPIIQNIDLTNIKTPTPVKAQTPTKLKAGKANASKPPNIQASKLEELPMSGGEALLKAHGITFLTEEAPPTVRNAVQGGRTLVLSDAGKLMLKESSVCPRKKPTTRPSALPVKVFALNNNMLLNKDNLIFNKDNLIINKDNLIINKDNLIINKDKLSINKDMLTSNKLNETKIIQIQRIEPTSISNEVKEIFGPTENTISTTSYTGTGVAGTYVRANTSSTTTVPIINKLTPNTAMESSVGTNSTSIDTNINTDSNTSGTSNNTVRIVMHKDNYKKLVKSATAQHKVQLTFPANLPAETAVLVPEQYVRSASPRYLRAQLLAAHVALHHLASELRSARDQCQPDA